MKGLEVVFHLHAVDGGDGGERLLEVFDCVDGERGLKVG